MEIKRAKGHGRYATFKVDLTESWPTRHVKLRPRKYGQTLSDEADRTNWANLHGLPVPTAKAFNLPVVAMLVSRTIEGQSSHKYIDVLRPEAIINGLSQALNIVRKASVADFPFSIPRWATQYGAEANIKHLTGKKHQELHPDFAQLTTAELRSIINSGPETKQAVLSHGDLCMPNVLLTSNGDVSGLVDLGGLHFGNDKLDLSVMSWTVQANMGTKWATKLLDTYGAAANDQGILYNRLAYDLGLEHENPWAWTETEELVAQRERLSELGASND